MKRTLLILATCLLSLSAVQAQEDSKSKIFFGGGVATGSQEDADNWITAINPTFGYKVNDFLSVGATLNLPIKFQKRYDNMYQSTGGELFSNISFSVWDDRLSLGGTLFGGLYLQGYYKFRQELDFVPYPPGTQEYEEWQKNFFPLNKVRWQVGIRPTVVVKVSSKWSLYGSYGFLGIWAPEDVLRVRRGAAKDVKFGWNSSGSFANGLRVGVLFSPWR
ncbi:MAG: hypothetical protein Q4D93_01430 [Porphyromonas sp.]|nr:hypothetical protein [Porphyromonas sp.]